LSSLIPRKMDLMKGKTAKSIGAKSGLYIFFRKDFVTFAFFGRGESYILLIVTILDDTNLIWSLILIIYSKGIHLLSILIFNDDSLKMLKNGV
jgi:hypothetical protein